MASEMRITFQEELEQVEAALQEEADYVLRALRAAVNAVEQADPELANDVIAFDDEIDQRYFTIQEGVQSLLARQTPVAVDLRLVLAMLHANLHLERMGDYCVTIAKLTKLVSDVEPDEGLVQAFEEMGQRAEEMIRIALDSFQRRDLAAASSLVDLDELIDRANRRAVERVLDFGSDESKREWGLRMILVSRCLERIGDHAVDIGEQTAFLVAGEHDEVGVVARKQLAAAPLVTCEPGRIDRRGLKSLLDCQRLLRVPRGPLVECAQDSSADAGERVEFLDRRIGAVRDEGTRVPERAKGVGVIGLARPEPVGEVAVGRRVRG